MLDSGKAYSFKCWSIWTELVKLAKALGQFYAAVSF